MTATVLLIEDDTTMLGLLSTLLEIEGFNAKTLVVENDAERILQEVHGLVPDVILMDVHLHRLNGMDLLRQIRQDKAVAHSKVLMSSGMDFKDECLKAGANGFLMKPYMPDDLINYIKKILAE